MKLTMKVTIDLPCLQSYQTSDVVSPNMTWIQLGELGLDHGFISHLTT